MFNVPEYIFETDMTKLPGLNLLTRPSVLTNGSNAYCS